MLQTIIIYLCGSLFIRGLYFNNYALISIGICISIFYIISEYFEFIYEAISSFKLNNKHSISIIYSLLLVVMGLFGYFKDPIQAGYLSIIAFLFYCSLILYNFKNIKELIYYPISRIFFGLTILGIIRSITNHALERYEMVSIEKARIREIIESTPNDWHPPFLGPWIITDTESNNP